MSAVDCGLFRSSQSSSSFGGIPGRMAQSYNGAGNTQYNAYPNNAANRRSPYINQIDQNQNNPINKNLPRTTGSGLSAWGLITIIMLIIVIGMGGYYGILCYPLICKEERNYDIMDAASTTASANTPTRSSDFEKSGNYSSRSTTPSVIINT